MVARTLTLAQIAARTRRDPDRIRHSRWFSGADRLSTADDRRGSHDKTRAGPCQAISPEPEPESARFFAGLHESARRAGRHDTVRAAASPEASRAREGAIGGTRAGV